jgi:tryptophan synthase alpha chain
VNRYAAMFDRCRAKGEGALGTFLMLGDPNPETCLVYLDAMVSGGADMVEVGIPFSDPVADGPVIQAAAVRALRAGVRTADCMAMIAEFRRRYPDVPLGLLTYANIVSARGIDSFASDLAAAGADSLLVADVPQLEARPYAHATERAGIDLVMIAAANTPDAALERIAGFTSGYTYCVARAGVTGAGSSTRQGHRALFERLALLQAPPPVLGFGISDPKQVSAAVENGARGIIVGSAIVSQIAQGACAEAIRDLTSTFKAATRPRQSRFDR